MAVLVIPELQNEISPFSTFFRQIRDARIRTVRNRNSTILKYSPCRANAWNK
jgi:hypothetical protein